ncbi:MAG: hypothetical protein ABFS14_06690 [Gemmatimonadota bacterium]
MIETMGGQVSGQASTLEARPPWGATNPVWGAVQMAGLLATVGLLVGLVWRPEPSLNLLWNVIIPLVPASLLISPMLWRNSCPLATLNNLSNGRIGRRSQSKRFAVGAGALGIVLLFVLVPARRFLFNADGTALAVTIAAVAILALVAGSLFIMRAGFCNAICPVQPVERLYGQSPLLEISNQRCPTCVGCSVGCIDQGPRTATEVLLNAKWNSAAWLSTPYGAFTALFPGFVLGYFTTVNGPLSTAGQVYGHVALWALIGAVPVVLLVLVFRVSASIILPTVAGVAAGFYYWFAAPAMATAVGIGALGGVGLKAVTLILVAVWLSRAWKAAVKNRGLPAQSRSLPVR